MARRRVRRALGLGAATALVALVLSGIASAHPASCTYDGTNLVTVSLGPGESVALSVLPGGGIAMAGTQCDTATVTNTDTITIAGTGSANQLSIDLSGGAFAPGKTQSEGPDSEIQFTGDLGQGGTLHVIGGPSSDFITFGAQGIDLNANEASLDADVTVTGASTLQADGDGGNDTLSAAGGQNLGAAVGGLTLHGDDGDDSLVEGLGGDQIDGGAGTDTLDFGGSTQADASLASGTATVNGTANTTFTGIENLGGSPGDDHLVGDANANVIHGGGGDDTIEGGPGDDHLFGGDGTDTADFSDASQGVVVALGPNTASGDGNDQVVEFENVIGSAFDDTLSGDGAANVLSAGAGDDLVSGGAGDDELDGGAGTDTLDFTGSSKGVQVDLGRGSATGQGTDELAGFENVNGSSHNDTVKGDAGPNLIEGQAGHDDLEGRKGPDFLSGGKNADLLFGGMGNDHLKGGPGKDQLDGGQGTDTCSGGPDPDAWTLCEAGPSH